MWMKAENRNAGQNQTARNAARCCQAESEVCKLRTGSPKSRRCCRDRSRRSPALPYARQTPEARRKRGTCRGTAHSRTATSASPTARSHRRRRMSPPPRESRRQGRGQADRQRRSVAPVLHQTHTSSGNRNAPMSGLSPADTPRQANAAASQGRLGERWRARQARRAIPAEQSARQSRT